MKKAYHNDPEIKAKYLARVRAHRKADELIQGTGWVSNGKTKGCAVGCTLDAYDHTRYPVELGIPVELAYLEDQLFELQSPTQAMKWPERFLTAIAPGADLSRVWPKWAVWMLVDPTHGVIRHAGNRADVKKAIEDVAELWRSGGTPEQLKRAAWAARAAAAAWAAEAAAWADGKTLWVTAACDKLIALLKAAKGSKS